MNEPQFNRPVSVRYIIIVVINPDKRQVRCVATNLIFHKKISDFSFLKLGKPIRSSKIVG